MRWPAPDPAPDDPSGGVVPAFSSLTTIQSGEWASIYGTNLAGGTAIWTGNFPVSLGGTSATIDGKSAYLLLASPSQINLQVPKDTATGAVPVVVTTACGSATSTVTLAPFGPSFFLLDTQHVAGIILRSNGSGAYGGGSYDIIGPAGTSLGYPTVAAKAGDTVELFGVGFGPTNPVVHAGEAFSGAAATTSPSMSVLRVASKLFWAAVRKTVESTRPPTARPSMVTMAAVAIRRAASEFSRSFIAPIYLAAAGASRL